MTRRSAIIAFVAVALVGIAGLLVAASQYERTTAFSPGVPSAGPQVALHPGQVACENPTLVQASFASVTAWLGGTANPGAALEMSIRSAGGARLATASIPATDVASSTPVFKLSRTVAAGQWIVVCLHAIGPQTTQVLGSSGQFTLLFLRPHPESLLSAIPSIFDRAALFRPTWVGAWTFWALLALLGVAFVACGVAVAKAVGSDLAGDEPGS